MKLSRYEGEKNMIDEKKLKIMSEKPGFIAALDQSGGSTPNVLRDYGIPDDTYHTDEEMFNLAHDMRYRIITSPDFSSDYVLAAILFEDTMKRTIEGVNTCEYLWDKKEIIPFLKIDQGLDVLKSGAQMMNPIEDLDNILEEAKNYNIFGTKMRSLILNANPVGIKDVVAQQFELATTIYKKGFLPILEPEIDINSTEKGKTEIILKEELLKALNSLDSDVKVILKLSLPKIPNFYEDLMTHPNVVRVAALSGGYNKAEADKKLSENKGMIASFSRALEEGLAYQETDIEFNFALKESVDSIYRASIK